jgi:hypothetical protein
MHSALPSYCSKPLFMPRYSAHAMMHVTVMWSLFQPSYSFAFSGMFPVTCHYYVQHQIAMLLLCDVQASTNIIQCLTLATQSFQRQHVPAVACSSIIAFQLVKRINVNKPHKNFAHRLHKKHALCKRSVNVTRIASNSTNAKCLFCIANKPPLHLFALTS